MKYYKSNLYSKRKYYEVDKIIMRKIVKGKKYYLIKWEGYSLESCSWEPISHLENILDMVKEFDNNFPDSIEQEDYQQFLKLYKRYRIQKMLNKKKIMKNRDDKTLKSHKFIINLEELNNSNNMEQIKSPKKNKIDTLDYLKENITKFNDTKEVNSNDENTYNKNGDYGKLIKPIMIW